MSEYILDGITTALKVTKDTPVVIEVSNGLMSVGTYNDYHSVVYECPTDLEDFKAVLSFQTAKELPKILSSENIELSLEKDVTLVVSSGDIKLRLSLLDPSVLSIKRLTAKYSTNFEWEVDGVAFNNSLSRVSHAANDASIGDVVLRGYHLTEKSDSIEFMASNGAILSIASVPATPISDQSLCRVVLLNQEFNQATQLLYPSSKLAISNDTISFESVDGVRKLKVTSILTKGTGFNYQPVLDATKQNTSFASFDTKLLTKSVKKVTFFTDEIAKNKLRFSFTTTGKVNLYSSNNYGEALVTLDAIDSNMVTDFSVFLSGVHLLKYLSSLKSGSVTLYLKDENSPIRLEDGLSKEVMVTINT